MPRNLPDPCVTKIGSEFYLVATGGGPTGAFRMLRSKDLVTWEDCGQARMDGSSSILFVMSTCNEYNMHMAIILIYIYIRDVDIEDKISIEL